MTIECVEKHIKFGFKAKKSQAAISQLLAIFSVPRTELPILHSDIFKYILIKLNIRLLQ